MKKIFLIPLMTLVCSVVAWGSEIVVNDFASLKTALSASGTADVVKLGQDITYGSEVLNIERSLTLDGQGHKIIGSVACELSISNDKTFVRNTIIAVNRGNVGSELDVTVKNLFIQHSGNDRREICFAIFDDVAKFALDAVETDGRTKSKDMQALLITGSDATPVQLDITNSKLSTANYPAYILKPITLNMSNTTISGYCGLYFKYQWSSGNNGYGNTVGSRGSVINADACTFDCPNVTNGESNNFAIFPLEDDGITLNLNNCSFNASTLGQEGNAYQRFVNLQYWARGGENGLATAQNVKVTVSGDNTHLYGVTCDKLIHNAWSMMQQSPSTSEGNNNTCVDINADNFIVEFTGGTFSFDPALVQWVLKSDNITRQNNYHGGSGRVTINSEGYEIKEVSQGGSTVYRVVKKAAEKEPGVMYDLNDLVPEEGEAAGNNPVSSFDLSTGEEMELNQATTKAGYVQISDNGDEATVVKVGKVEDAGTPEEAKVDQVLIINNGLDVQGESAVEVQPGSALVIGEGGIVTEKPENIVIEADSTGAASLLLNPAITVNSTPYLTVKMTTKPTGKIASGEYWHRFAMPVEHIDGWTKEGSIDELTTTYPTYLYGWDYDNDEWKKLTGGVSDMRPFQGYTLRLVTEQIAGLSTLQEVTYIFKGNLAGNVNSTLNFSKHGYNYFGNSYTGYISILSLVEQLLGHANIQGTIWVWNTENQKFEDVALGALRDYADLMPAMYPSYKKEVAPMQTFILKFNGSDEGSTEINYASAVWGNPRYTGFNAAPARHANAISCTALEVVIAAANGQRDAVMFIEDQRHSDAFDNGYDASKYMNEKTVNVYATLEGEDLGTVATSSLEGKTISLNTNDEIAYTLSFRNVMGEPYAIKDNVTGKVIAIEEGQTYEFAAQPNSTVANRFSIVGVHKLPTSVETTEVKSGVKGIYTILGQYVGEDFQTLPAGVYVIDGVKIVK